MFGSRFVKSFGVAAAGVLVVGAVGVGVYAQQSPAPGTTPPQAGRQMRGMGRFFGPGGPGGPGRLGGPLGHVRLALGALDLSEAQRDQIRTIVQTHQAETQALGERLRGARKAVDDAVTAEPYSEARIRDTSAALAAVMADGAVLRARVRSEVWQVLTPEQQKKATELKAQAVQRREQRSDRMKQRMQDRRQRRVQAPPAGEIL